MLDILAYLPAKRKRSPNGWLSFNAVCCPHNGESSDTRQRGGLKVTDQGWSYHCFNCSYTASFVLGRTLGFKARRLLGWMGVPDSDIDMLNLESMRHRSIHGILEDRQKTFNALSNISFEEFDDLPPFSEVVTPELKHHWDYLRSRKVPEDYPCMTAIQNDGIHWVRPHITIPFTYDDQVVGWTARFLDNKIPKYINHTQTGYVFGTDLQKPEWEHVLVMEGVICALSISGLAVMHNTVSDAQARLIRSLGKPVTVVPDQDQAGLELIDRAMELGWAVSIPSWGNHNKDVNDSVVEHGKLATLLMIMQSRETSKIKIEIRKKQLAKRIRLDVQRLFLEMMLEDAQSYVRVQNIYNPQNFDKSLRPAAEFIKEHSDKYKTLPDRTQIAAACNITLAHVPDLNEGHFEWFMTEFESFTKRQELERAILKAADLLEKGEYDPVEKLIKDAVQISLTKDMGTDYFADPKSRIEKYFNSGGQVSTGWPQLDRLLYGGFSRGELNIFAGGSGSGKSLVMMNIALNWLQQGLSGVYITLELSEELTSLRTDAMLTNMSTKDIRRDIDTTELKVKMVAKKSGNYQVKGLPAQSNINDIRAYLKEYQIQTGKKVDFVMIDYLDLLMPVSAKVSPNDLFVKDKYVSEELRNLAKELGILMVTASQLNRSAVEEIEFDHSHISGGISKINTADNVFGIFTSRAMKERGKYQIQCMKSRSSTGVGQKIDLEYNIETMRITDEGGDEGTGYNRPQSSIMDSIKAKSQVKAADTPEETDAPPKWERATGTPAWEKPAQDTGKVTADVQSAKLKQLLGKIKAS